MGAMQLRLLGGFELRDAAGAVVRLPTRKAEALLAYLAVDSRQSHSREDLAALLWGDADERSSLASLRQTLSLIGKCCGGAVFKAEGRRIAWVPGAVEVDVAAFIALSAAGGGADVETLSQAAALNRGDLLAGVAVSGSRFEDWLTGERARLRERAIDLLGRLALAQQARGWSEPAVQTSLALLQIDPMAEAGHRLLMDLYVHSGRRGAALRQYQVCLNVLQRELGAEPELQTRQLYNRLLRQPPPQAPAGVDRPALEPGRPSFASPAGLSVHEAPLTGRDTELTLLRAALDEARSGRGRTVALLGEAGLGKTRLAEELAARAPLLGVQVLLGRCHESQQLFPFAPWVDLLRGAGVPADQALLESLEPAWRVELAVLLPELQNGPDRPDDETTAPAQRARLFEAIVQLLGRLVQRAPTLLVLEDLHWADEMSLRLLTQVARRGQDWPLMTLVTAREEELDLAPRLRRSLRELAIGQGLARIELRPLTQPQIVAIAQGLWPPDWRAPVASQAAERVWQISEGNPFVAVEAAQTLGTGPVQAQDASPLLPDRVRELIHAHVERVSPPARRLVAVLAVAGRELDFAVMQAAAGQDAQTAAEAVEELVRRRILRALDEAFDFRHARIRRAVTEDLLAPMVGPLHLAIARALEQAYAADPGPVADRLAYHYARTDHHDKAVHYLGRLALRAAHEGVHEQALATLDDALRHAAGAAGPQGLQLRRELVFRKARSLFFLGRFGEVLDLLLPQQMAVDAAADPRMAGAYYLRLASTFTYLGEHARSIASAERALREATACAEPSTMGKAHFQLALEHFWAQPVLGAQHGRQAVAMLEGTGERWWLGQACWILGLNLSYLGSFREGLQLQVRAQDLADAIGDRRLASYAAWTTGFIHSLDGDLDDAVAACERSVSLALDPLNRMTAQGMLALAWVERGDTSQASGLLDEVVPQAARFRIPQMLGLFLAFRAEAALQAGDLLAARAFAERGAQITRDANYRYGLGWAQRVQSRIARAGGERGEAEDRLAQAIATFQGMGAPFEAARTRIELAELLEHERPAQARTLAQAGLVGLTALGLDRHAARAQALLGRMH
jgi:DNA-binding SARP family transcriptional activator